MAGKDEPNDELLGRIVGGYTLLKRIAEGGFALVYRGEQPLLGREVVIKVLRENLRGRDIQLQRFPAKARDRGYDQDLSLITHASAYRVGMPARNMRGEHASSRGACA
ncbi:MAG TPA: hypothetical protein VHN14_29115 [Kofleriaceae bacterium]|jgi:serine/threonine protein kinase|nr:hypothetical protein [Kofleriaceae bacterium]